MADSKISDLSAITTLDGTEEFVVADSGTTKKITAADVGTSIGGGGGTWQDYTPVLTAVSSNPTLGTGGTIQGRYFTLDDAFVYVSVRIAFGTSGTGAGSGIYLVSLPVTPSTGTFAVPGIGHAWALDSSTSISYVAWCHWDSGTNRALMLYHGGIHITHALPFAWSASDLLYLHLTYEAA